LKFLCKKYFILKFKNLNYKKNKIKLTNQQEEKMNNDKYTFTETLKSELVIAAIMFIPLTFTITGLF
jgi:hypothetical protein|tara:strand:+ start:5704 stop:5904 length:201 start_codon:yes stop_codon:yes gene_type:complete